MTRQQRRKQLRVREEIDKKVNALRSTNPIAEEAYKKGYAEGWKAACEYCMKACYAASALALHDIEGYGQKRNARFLRKMDGYVARTLDTEEIMDEALQKAGVWINFREPFPEDRIQEVQPG